MKIPTTVEKIRQVMGREHASRAGLNNTENSARRPNTGTLVLALKYKDGVVFAADRMMIAGGNDIVSMSVKKIFRVSGNSAIGYAGSVDAVQILAKAYFRLLNLNSFDGGTPGIIPQVKLLHSLLQEFFAVYGEDFFANVIFAAADPATGERRITEFCGAARMDCELFGAIGCGGEKALDVLGKYGALAPDEISETDALKIVLEGLIAGARSPMVSHPKLAEPTIMLVKKEGVRELAAEEMSDAQKGVLR